MLTFADSAERSIERARDRFLARQGAPRDVSPPQNVSHVDSTCGSPKSNACDPRLASLEGDIARLRADPAFAKNPILQAAVKGLETQCARLRAH